MFFSLQDVLGQRLVTVIAKVSDVKAIGKWARGDQAPAIMLAGHPHEVLQAARDFPANG